MMRTPMTFQAFRTSHTAKLCKLSFLMLFLFLLPWQTRWILHDVLIGDDVSQYGRLSVYLIDVVLMGYVTLAIATLKKGTVRSALKRPIFRTIAYASVGLSVWAYLSMIWSPSPLVALFGALHLDLAMGFLLVALMDRGASIGYLMSPLLLGMFVPGGLAWVQAAAQSIDASTILGIAAQDPTVLGTSVIEHSGGRWLRAYGSFPHPNILGGFSAVGLLLTFQMLAQRLGKSERIIGWLMTVVLSGALVLSASRSAWLAFALGMGLWCVGLFYLQDFARMVRLRFPIFIAGLTMFVLVLSIGPILTTRFDDDNRLESRSMTERTAQLHETTQLLKNPYTLLGGVGMHSAVYALAQRQPFLPAYEYQPVHNVLLLVVTELGLIGFALVVTIVIASDWRVHVHWKRPTSLMAMSFGLTLLVIALFDHYLWSQVSGLYLLAVFLVMNTKCGQLSRSIDRQEENTRA
ncbi:hypothetical protein A3I45_03415 [Candidatus Uhrbacteria bacterium RIFCSPLOWO2_02_FULL_53_10]|uniref:O-antigen ligase-related domain-containing protein n=1 Tax=Candidatus Uhrbacteria bacterium RIFCSPLOWO2_02_FULL_53_10 TaxID=1802411 RepID=A0A1F7VGR8_9BACT|nr:MAG: hypothetical protein A3I45_03415 [Candidatus Uhrbacteria bacterium RIFCSPLOWO2_02_FULL_53_10]